MMISMKIIPLAVNHVLIEFDGGAVIDLNENTGSKSNSMRIGLDEKFKHERNLKGIRVYMSAASQSAFSAQVIVYENDDKEKDNKVANMEEIDAEKVVGFNELRARIKGLEKHPDSTLLEHNKLGRIS